MIITEFQESIAIYWEKKYKPTQTGDFDLILEIPLNR